MTTGSEYGRVNTVAVCKRHKQQMESNLSTDSSPLPPSPSSPDTSSSNPHDPSLSSSTLNPSSPTEASSPPALTKEEKREKRRICVVNEILSSEQTYVKRLELAVELFIHPLREKNILTNDEFKKQFGNLEIIRDLHQKLLQDLQQAATDAAISSTTTPTTTMSNEMNPTTTPHSTPPPTSTLKIGKIFKKFIGFFKMYKDYLTSYEGSTIRLAKLVTSNRKFVDFLEKARADPRSLGLGIDSFLMEPVQRIPRYRMLLEELLKYTAEDNDDYRNIAEALEIVYLSSLLESDLIL